MSLQRDLVVLVFLLAITVAVGNSKGIGGHHKDVVDKKNKADHLSLPYAEESHLPDSSEFEAVELPTAFTTYDLDGNGFVNLSELAEVTETKEADAKFPFSDADSNGDGVLDQEEFLKAPWAFNPKIEADLS